MFANARDTRVRRVAHDGFGVGCAARRFNPGRFVSPGTTANALPALTRPHFDALVLGLPWQRRAHMQTITHM